MKYIIKILILEKTGINNFFTNKDAGGPENFKKIKAINLDIKNNVIKIKSKPYSANYLLTQKIMKTKILIILIPLFIFFYKSFKFKT